MINRDSLSILATSVLTGLWLASCSTPQPEEPPVQETPAQPAPPPPLYEWDGDGMSGATSVKVDIDQQKVFVYKGGKQAGWGTIASGIYARPTPTGSFKVQEKVADKRSNLWGKIYNSSGKVVVSDAKSGRDEIPAGGKFVGASMPFWMRLTSDGIGMHQGPIPRPGHRASHGCIRVHAGFIRHLFDAVSVGTPVAVVGDGPRWKPPVYKPTPKPTTPAPEKVADKTAPAPATAAPAATSADKPAPAAPAPSSVTPPTKTPPAAAPPVSPAPSSAAPEPPLEVRPAVPSGGSAQ
ncbi:MAG: L,D-transpeptidase [Verrucomicrobiales bacterium]|nr:L,D-transpeptidase [Verrucomicrobiales bacterium]